MIWFTSDTHFGHKNILQYCPNRKFSSIEEHDKYLIDIWNSKVKPEDVVFHCGDFSFGSLDFGLSVLDKLNGTKVLITGNHDQRNLKSHDFRNKFSAVKFGYHEISFRHNDGSQTLAVLCHYPLETWNKVRYNSYHFHGHCHTPKGSLKVRFMKNRKDVGVDGRDDLAPWSLTELTHHINNQNEKDLSFIGDHHTRGEL